LLIGRKAVVVEDHSKRVDWSSGGKGVIENCGKRMGRKLGLGLKLGLELDLDP
jgi:hypothetical protein